MGPGPTSTLRVGEVVASDGRRFQVTAADLDTVARMRALLIAEARDGSTITYGEVIRALGISVVPQGLGRLLVLLSEDCARRGEPTLAAIVVTASTGEVGRGYGPSAARDRRDLHAYWASPPRRPGRT